MNTLPTIGKQEIQAASEQPDELIHLLIKSYNDIIVASGSQDIMEHFTLEQNVLWAFNVLDGQVSNGGFIQLIENKYGAYIFDTPLSDLLRECGLEATADIIDRARVLYESKKDVLEKEKTLEEFAKLYAEHKEFEPLEAEFYSMIESERMRMNEFIMGNLSGFVIAT